jgi:hypothetical protein
MKTIQCLKTLGKIAVGTLCLTVAARGIVLDFSVSGIGSYTPASSLNNDADVTTAVNLLVNWYNGGANPTGGGTTFTLSAGSGVPGPLRPAPITFGFKDESAPFVDVNSATFSYVLGKYGNAAYLFYIGNLPPGSYSLPNTLVAGGNSLSHEVAFAAGGTSVPDGGTTMALLGLGLLGVAFMQRKVKLA